VHLSSLGQGLHVGALEVAVIQIGGLQIVLVSVACGAALVRCLVKVGG